MKLEHLFKRYKGQPIEILTEDGVRYCGIEVDYDDESVEIVDSCSRVIYVPYRHITAVVEPKMKLSRFCAKYDCDCENGIDPDCECNQG